MEMEKKARLGDKYKPKEQHQSTPIGNVELGVKQIQVAHPPNLFPEMAKTALKTILLYLCMLFLIYLLKYILLFIYVSKKTQCRSLQQKNTVK